MVAAQYVRWCKRTMGALLVRWCKRMMGALLVRFESAGVPITSSSELRIG